MAKLEDQNRSGTRLSDRVAELCAGRPILADGRKGLASRKGNQLLAGGYSQQTAECVESYTAQVQSRKCKGHRFKGAQDWLEALEWDSLHEKEAEERKVF